MNTARFSGLAAIVTGAANGIGAAIAGRLAGEGASVLIADIDAAGAEARARSLGAASGRPAISQACDVADEAQVARCFALAVERFGRIDVVVNNAGLMTFKGLADWSADDWLKVLGVDLVGAALFTKHALLAMATHGGCIVNVASVHAVMTTANVAPYAAAKAGLLSLTRSTAIEGKAAKVRANAVLPGAIDTGMLWSNPNVQSGVETIDRRDVGSADDIAAAVAFLASAEAKFINGASLVVDGGRLAAL